MILERTYSKNKMGGSNGSNVELFTRKIMETYDDYLPVYRYNWRQSGHTAIHSGIYTQKNDTEKDAVNNTIEALADLADVDSDDTVLNIGCGPGYGLRWKAKNIGSEVIGIEINEKLVQMAREAIEDSDYANNCKVHQDDFNELESIKRNSVDVVWALEAFCHAPSLPRITTVIDRVLTANGKLVLGDMFTNRADLTQETQMLVEDIENSGAMRFHDVGELKSSLRSQGLQIKQTRNVTQSIQPGYRKIYRNSRILHPLYWLLSKLHLSSQDRREFFRVGKILGRLVNNGSFQYRLILAEKV